MRYWLRAGMKVGKIGHPIVRIVSSFFDKPYPDFDVAVLHAYAKSKGVKIIMHHETAANAADYERQLDEPFNLW